MTENEILRDVLKSFSDETISIINQELDEKGKAYIQEMNTMISFLEENAPGVIINRLPNGGFTGSLGGIRFESSLHAFYCYSKKMFKGRVLNDSQTGFHMLDPDKNWQLQLARVITEHLRCIEFENKGK
jgi:hypothetical protein